MLKRRWTRFMKRVELMHSFETMKGGEGKKKVFLGVNPDIYEGIRERFSAPGRPLHNLQHLEFCLKQFEHVRKLLDHPIEVEFAVWFHDYLRRTEEKNDWVKYSARYAVWVASLFYFDEASQIRIEKYIRATCHASVPDNQDAKYLLDIDNAILGGSRRTYLSYENRMRMEYGWVDDDKYRRKRMKNLNDLLSRQTIYFTHYFRKHFERRAKKNLKAHIKTLASLT